MPSERPLNFNSSTNVDVEWVQNWLLNQSHTFQSHLVHIVRFLRWSLRWCFLVSCYPFLLARFGDKAQGFCGMYGLIGNLSGTFVVCSWIESKWRMRISCLLADFGLFYLVSAHEFDDLLDWASWVAEKVATHDIGMGRTPIYPKVWSWSHLNWRLVVESLSHGVVLGSEFLVTVEPAQLFLLLFELLLDWDGNASLLRRWHGMWLAQIVSLFDFWISRRSASLIWTIGRLDFLFEGCTSDAFRCAWIAWLRLVLTQITVTAMRSHACAVIGAALDGWRWLSCWMMIRFASFALLLFLHGRQNR